MADPVPEEAPTEPAPADDAAADAGAPAEGDPKPEDAAADGAEKKEEGAEGGDGAAEGGGDKKEPPDTGVGDRIKKDPHELDFLVPLPEKIEFHMIPKINEARSVWRIGMRKLEETFAEHIANMHLDFEDKA